MGFSILLKDTWVWGDCGVAAAASELLPPVSSVSEMDPSVWILLRISLMCMASNYSGQ